MCERAFLLDFSPGCDTRSGMESQGRRLANALVASFTCYRMSMQNEGCDSKHSSVSSGGRVREGAQQTLSGLESIVVDN